MTVLDLAAFAKDLAALFRSALEAADIEFHVSIDELGGPVALCLAPTCGKPSC